MALDKQNRLRPAFGAYFKSLPDGFDFHIVVVHLKSLPKYFSTRQDQWFKLGEIIRRLPEGKQKDEDIILLGDFNHVSKHGVGEFLPFIDRANFYWTAGGNMTIVSKLLAPGLG